MNAEDTERQMYFTSIALGFLAILAIIIGNQPVTILALLGCWVLLGMMVLYHV